LTQAQDELAAALLADPNFATDNSVDALGNTYAQVSATIQSDQTTATDALNAAANKTPVSQDTQDALDGLLAGK
jgi:hypothetical protein